jgi:hypothetical protein
MLNLLFLLCACLALAATTVHANDHTTFVPVPAKTEVITKTIDAPDGFFLMHQTCIGFGDGIVARVNLEVTPGDGAAELPDGVQILFFDDEDRSWPISGNLNEACAVRANNPGATNFRQRNDDPTRYTVNLAGSPPVWDMATSKLTDKIKPRVWYFVAANCHNNDKGFKMNIKLTVEHADALRGHVCGEPDPSNTKRTIGIVIIVVVVLLLLVCLCCCVYRRRRAQRYQLAGRNERASSGKGSDDMGMGGVKHHQLGSVDALDSDEEVELDSTVAAAASTPAVRDGNDDYGDEEGEQHGLTSSAI